MRGERPLDHLPLHRVGVLKFVHYHHRPALAHARRRGQFSDSSAREAAQQIVVSENSALAFPLFNSAANIIGEVHPDGGVTAGRRSNRSKLHAGIFDHFQCHCQCVTSTQGRSFSFFAELGKVEIVDDLGNQIVHALHQLQADVGVACHPERFQHQSAELMDCGDRGCVEFGDGVA